jgi:exopolysaccharide biosynthesis polyprenyl glycosylphosphotransferase
VCLFAAFSTTLWLRFESGVFVIRDQPHLPSYAAYAFLSAAFWSLFSRFYRVDELVWEEQRLGAFAGAACRAALASMATVSVCAFFYRGYSFSRVMVGSFWALHLVLVLAGGLALSWLRRRWTQPGGAARLLVLGGGEFAATLARRLEQAGLCAGRPALCSPHDPAWSARLASGEFDEVLVALPLEEGSRLRSLLEELRHAHTPVRVALDLPGGTVREFADVPVLDLGSSPSDRLSYAWAKRVFDLTLAAAALGLGAPLAALIAALIKLTSPGPVFFVQERVGVNGRTFRMYKFRTLPVRPAETSETEWSPTSPEDAGRLGCLLRRLRLDEWPQFWNVLKGEMSVVGPRPERVHFAAGFRQALLEYGLRHRLKAGITGWAQVHGLTGDTAISRRLEYDLYYLRHWSLLLDLRIVLLTIWAAVGPPVRK